MTAPLPFPHWLSQALPEPRAWPVRTERTVQVLRLTGVDSLRFLHGQTTQDLGSAPPGCLRRSCAVTATARLTALLDVLVDQQAARLMVLAGDGPALHQSFDRHLFPADQVTLLPVVQARQVSLLGEAAALLAAEGITVDAAAAGWGPVALGDAQALLVGGTDFGDGAPGLRLLLPDSLPLPPWLERCPRLTTTQVELLRLQQGMPAWPNEINGDFNPFELGLAGAVALDKGCYLGQEVLARLVAYDGVKQQLRLWGSPTPLEALPEDNVVQGEDGARAGVITSRLALGPGSVGLAVVRRAWLGSSTLNLGHGTVSLSLPGAAQFPPGAGKTDRHILDNRTGTVAAYLRQALADGEDFSVVSAYFTIHGYGLLADRLESVGRTRFLFGDPGSVEDLDPGQKEPKAFALTEGGLEPRYVLVQKALARRCAAWVRQSAVEIRTVSRANFLHGKMYLTASPHGQAGVVGSSNFTKRGLGAGDQPNLEVNLATEDQETVDELRAWFDRLWADDGYTRDVKQQVLDALAHIGNDYAPEAVYYKTLYELLRQEIAARQAGDDSATTTGLKDSQVWNKLYQFQQDGARSVIAKLVDHNGCILADSVGLGKTYTALAVIKYFELRNGRVLVLCPRKLHDNWSLYPASNNHPQNPFPQDRFGYTLLAHTDLSRDSGRSGNVDLAHFQWGNYDLVVIDESHNFRNAGGGRYKRLLEEVIRAGGQTKVLMLSATPVNTSLMDLRNQIHLMTEGRDQAFQDSLGVRSIRALMTQAQKEFKQWEQQSQGKRRDKAQLLDSLGADFLRLLNGVSISRSRRQIEQFYADEMERIGRFPQRAQPVNTSPHTDSNGKLSYQDLAERIEEFKLAVYQPSAYVVDQRRLDELESKRKAQNFNQKDSERFLVGMMRVNLLKRLESSAHALRLTMDRTIQKINNLLKKIERYEQGDESQTHGLIPGETMPEDDDEDEEFVVNRSRHPYRLAELDLPRWTSHLKEDKAMLSTVRDQVAAVTPERDGKLQDLKQCIRHKAGQPNRKLLVFTTFKDTAKYLYDNLQSSTKKLGIAMAMLSGDETHTTVGPNNFNAVLSNFAPTARQRREADANPDIDLLIATDCISEGQNLQDCDTVLNYDIHWNPVRLVQRFGRIDRIGSRNRSVQMVNYWPTEDMDTYLRLQNRVQARMALADLTASGDEDPFSEEDMARDLRFRDAQLLQLRQEIPHLEDLEDAPVLADFTLDDFLTQLLRYLERNRAALEAMPSGVYAVTENAAPVPEAQAAVIFCLRQRNATTDKQHRPASPVHPHYLVHVQSNGAIRYGCGSARNILMAFEAAAAGQTRPITRLCQRFDQETQNGRRMERYETLLSAGIAQIRQAHHRTQAAGLGRSGAAGFKLPRAAETPRDARDFELVTWLVIQEAT